MFFIQYNTLPDLNTKNKLKWSYFYLVCKRSVKTQTDGYFQPDILGKAESTFLSNIIKRFENVAYVTLCPLFHRKTSHFTKSHPATNHCDPLEVIKVYQCSLLQRIDAPPAICRGLIRYDGLTCYFLFQVCLFQCMY